MQTQNRILDDLARLANGAAGLASGMREEIEGLVKSRLDRLLADMDLVPRDEFEAVKELAANARSEQEVLASRVSALEAALAALSTTANSSTAKSLDDD